MKLECLSLQFSVPSNSRKSELKILDQTVLPHYEKWVTIENTDQMIEAIKMLRVRGAPLIGVSAALALAHSALHGNDRDQLMKEAQALYEARPTAVNLMTCVERMKSSLKRDDSIEKFVQLAIDIFNEDVELCEKMGANGADLFQDGDQILTHCNTGGLATVGIGTALGVIRKAHEQGKKIHVYVDETRPLLQGGRLTSWELQRLGIPMTLITDNMAAHLMSQGKITKAIVGSDRIAANGDFANKIGTYNVAVLCHYHKIPFYVAAPYTTVDSQCDSGKQIPIEQRGPHEVWGYKGMNEEVYWAPKNSPVYNPSFDVTPKELVSAWILDKAVYTKKDIDTGILKGG